LRPPYSRASIVNFNGHVLYDSYIKPEQRITNFLTPVSGITPQSLKTAPTFALEKPKVAVLDR
jgi:RNA exonuclease 4